MEKYLSKTRHYRYEDIILEIPPDVFHPGFFSSTNLLLQNISHLPLSGRTVLELGAGSGLISIYAAKKGAVVTASDINPVAIAHLHINSLQNKVDPLIIRSDLFAHLPRQEFDIIAINPPYYLKKPNSWLDHAWYCGENGEYFQGLFSQLGDYMTGNTEALMVLCDGCDLDLITQIALENNLALKLLLSRQYLLEKNFIYKIEKKEAQKNFPKQAEANN